MPDTVPAAPPPLVMVERTSDHQPAILLGFVATGDEASKAALGKAATRAGFPVGRSTNNNNEDEVMVSFPKNSDRNSALNLFHQAQAGNFGYLRLEIILVPVSKLADGFNLGEDAEVDPRAELTEPRN